MIQIRPKGRALLSIGLFILACLSLGVYNLVSIVNGEGWWLNYVIAGLLIPLGLVLIIRQMASYKVLVLGNNEIIVRHPFIRQSAKIALGKIDSWSETAIKTTGGNYRQLNIIGANINIRISQQEHLNYSKAISYLEKKAKRARRK